MMSNAEVTLSDFADLHAVSRNEALRLWKAGFIAGRKSNQGKQIILAEQGKRDLWVQCHTSSNFRSCDHCPHTI